MSLINVVNPFRLKILFMIFLIGFLIPSCHKNLSHDDYENNLELDIMKQGSTYLEQGDFDKANTVYLQFIEKFPDNPYTDDAAYRLAYMCVIADNKNPYFDYSNAIILFQNFIENYPNSRYIIACKNWLNLLNSVMIISKESSLSPISNGSDLKEIKQLRNELKRVKAENTRLKNTLEELQKAIER